MSRPKSKFVQISACFAGEGVDTELYALDEDGVVWQWTSASEKRQPGWADISQLRNEERNKNPKEDE